MTPERKLAITIAAKVVAWQNGESCGTDPETGDFHSRVLDEIGASMGFDVASICRELLAGEFVVRYKLSQRMIIVERAQ